MGPASRWRGPGHRSTPGDAGEGETRQSGGPKTGIPPQATMTAAASLIAHPLVSLGLLAAVLLPCDPVWAQVETFINKPGSSVGPATKVVPTNCVTAPDGSLTCDTKIENPPSDTPTQPHFSPFRN